MDLRDHFRPPLHPSRSWESFHAQWIAALGDSLNRVLPDRYYAEIQVHFGGRIELDVATWERETPPPSERWAGNGGVAVAEALAWALTAPALTMPAVFPDELEVLVYNDDGGRALVAAVELISPGNKDRPATRRAFAAKCAGCSSGGSGWRSSTSSPFVRRTCTTSWSTFSTSTTAAGSAPSRSTPSPTARPGGPRAT